MKRINNCIKENTLTFEIDDNCFTFEELLTLFNNSEVTELLNQLIDKFDDIEAYTNVITEYVEVRTTNYVYVPNKSSERKNVIRFEPTKRKPDGDWTPVPGIKDWYYRVRRGRTYYINDFTTTFYGTYKYILSESQFFEIFTDYGKNKELERKHQKKYNEVQQKKRDEQTYYLNNRKQIEEEKKLKRQRRIYTREERKKLELERRERLKQEVLDRIKEQSIQQGTIRY